MRLRLRRKIRELVVWMMSRTDKWVMPPEFYELIAREKVGEAIVIFDEQLGKWGMYDPIIVKASVLIRVKSHKLREQQERNR